MDPKITHLRRAEYKIITIGGHIFIIKILPWPKLHLSFPWNIHSDSILHALETFTKGERTDLRNCQKFQSQVRWRSKRDGIYVCIQLIHFIVQQKLQHCKETITQLKKWMKVLTRDFLLWQGINEITSLIFYHSTPNLGNTYLWLWSN